MERLESAPSHRGGHVSFAAPRCAGGDINGCPIVEVVRGFWPGSAEGVTSVALSAEQFEKQGALVRRMGDVFLDHGDGGLMDHLIQYGQWGIAA